ncbi:MAG: hypothetical protein ABIP16_02275 [Thermomonas sp.]
MNIKIQLGLVVCASMLASLPAFGQSARFISQGVAYAYAEDHQITKRVIDQVIGTPVGEGTQIVFFRRDDTTPGTASLSESDVLLAQIPSGTHYAIAVTPGVHTYVVDGSALQLQLSPGERRFVNISNGPANPRPLPSNALAFLRITMGKRPPLY